MLERLVTGSVPEAAPDTVHDELPAMSPGRESLAKTRNRVDDRISS
jgi:hypothetical protein